MRLFGLEALHLVVPTRNYITIYIYNDNDDDNNNNNNNNNNLINLSSSVHVINNIQQEITTVIEMKLRNGVRLFGLEAPHLVVSTRNYITIYMIMMTIIIINLSSSAHVINNIKQ